MATYTSSWKSPSNIALVKYWGKKEGEVQIPANSSISFTLSNCATTTKLTYTEQDTQEVEVLLDGKLEEPFWQEVNESSGFWQFFPTDSILARHTTTIKMVYDEQNLYVGIKAYAPNNDFVVSSLKRDFRGTTTDNVSVLFDTFKDGINAFNFGASPYGVQRESLISEGGSTRNAFNPTWDVKWLAESSIGDDFYMIEMLIPFSSLKYPAGSKT